LTLNSGWITTVENQPSYDWPTGAKSIMAVFWNPDYAESSLDELYTNLLTEVVDVDNPSSITIEFQKAAQLRRFFSGHWQVVWDESGSRKIILIPTPSLDYALEAKAQYYMENTGWRAGSYSVSANAAAIMQRTADVYLTRIRHRLASGSGSAAMREAPNDQLGGI